MAERINFKMETPMDDKVSIIIVHNGRPDFLNLCLQSIALSSKNNNYEVIVVDNGSKDQDSLDFLDSLEDQDCKLIRNKENLWWSKAANQGVKAADPASKYFIFLHHDVVILSLQWIDVLVNIAQSQDCGLVGVSMDFYEMDDVYGKKVKLHFIEEWCMLTSRECWEDCGPFTEKLEQVGAPFMYTLNCKMQGYNPQVIRNSIAHHYAAFAVDVSEMAKFREKAMSLLPTLIKERQTKITGK